MKVKRLAQILLKNRKRPLVSDAELRLSFAESTELLQEASRSIRNTNSELERTFKEFERRHLHGSA